jgi:hypothetical protein
MNFNFQRLLLKALLSFSLTATIALVSSPAAASGPSPLFGKPVIPVPNSNGHGVKHLRNEIETSNWSGYAVAHFETGITYTSASGTWTVPTVTQPSPNTAGYSASWVGIGGFCQDANCHKVDKSLIQLGTEQNISSSGTTSYQSWYELLPNPPVAIPIKVSPGNVVTASLTDPSPTSPKHDPTSRHGGGTSTQEWTLTFTNISKGISWQTTLPYKSSLASAEWIEEAPTSGGTILPLANYSTASFDSSTVNGNSNPSLTTKNGITMLDPQGQTSNPSNPDSDTDGFSTCWGNGTSMTACSALSS